MHLSIVTPAYQCSECIEPLYQRLVQTLADMGISDYEILFVNDGSPHDDWEVISRLCRVDTKVKGINLAKNFGQHKAIKAGLDFARGEWVVIMDCDLQDQPEDIPVLYAKAQEGYSVVFGRRSGRQDAFLKKFFSHLFSMIFSYLVEQKIDSAVANFSIVHRKVVDELVGMREQGGSYVFLLYWLGFDMAYVDVHHARRVLGETTYNFRKLVNLAIDFSVSQSNKPLKMFIKLGLGIAFAAFLSGIYLIMKQLSGAFIVQGWTSIMVSLYFIGGMLMASMGVLGLYIGKIFDEVKARPIYVVKARLNMDDSTAIHGPLSGGAIV